jgi:hypothetical protein
VRVSVDVTTTRRSLYNGLGLRRFDQFRFRGFGHGTANASRLFRAREPDERPATKPLHRAVDVFTLDPHRLSAASETWRERGR